MKKIIVGLLLLAFFGCAEDDFDPALDFYSFFDFGDNLQGWEVDVADYAMSESDSIAVSYRRIQIEQDGAQKKALKVEVENVPSNAFIFLRNQIVGLEPNKLYEINFEITYQFRLSNIEAGDSFQPVPYTQRAGFSTIRPQSVQEDQEGVENRVKMNVDWANNAQFSYLTQTNTFTHNLSEDQFLVLENAQNPMVMETDNQGRIWFLFGSTPIQRNFQIVVSTIVLYYKELND